MSLPPPRSPWWLLRAGALAAASAVATAGLVAGASGCGSIDIGISGGDDTTAREPDASLPGPSDDGSAFAFADAGVLNVGSDGGIGVFPADATNVSVCGNTSACNPDRGARSGCSTSDAGTTHGTGDGDAGVSAPLTACRVTVTNRGASSTVATACVAEGTGYDGAACTSGADCSAGFECVGTPGVCRQYCCAGMCSDTSSFCDVQPTSANGDHAVPVCVPVQSCKLLMAGSCPAGTTCAVVADDGTTSCVAIGQSKEHDSCDSTHCAANEVCLGQYGARHCEKLCQIDGGACGNGEACVGNAELFSNSPIGLCE